MRAARLVGDGTRTATQGVADLLNEQIAGPARDRWLRGEVDGYPAEAVDAATGLFAVLPDLVTWLIQRYIEQGVTSGIADSFEDVLASAGLAPAPEPAQPPAAVFVDVSGYTPLIEERGDETAVRVATELQLGAEQIAGDHRGRLVKLLGDGAMLTFPDPGEAVDAAVELVDRLRELGVDAHGWVHAGRLIERDRDVFGRTVNIAARVAAAAAAGDVLVTEAAGRLIGAELGAGTPMQLKGSRNR